jgi:hypothetical protein
MTPAMESRERFSSAGGGNTNPGGNGAQGLIVIAY